MVVRSWQWLPISYHGPLESFAEFWYVLSRKGYAHVDASVSWSWLDRIRFFQFMVGQLYYKDAVLFVRGDVDLAPIGYFCLVEGWRPDIELYHSAGRVLGNRLFLPLRTTPEQAQAIMGKFIDEKQVPVTFTLESYSSYASRDHWLYLEVDKSSRDPQKVTIDIPEEAVRFFEESVASIKEPNAWVAFHPDELRRRYGSPR